MKLQRQREVENSRKKLRMLEDEYEAARRDSTSDAAAREAELQSLGELINQFKQEIARFEAHVAIRRSASSR